MNATPSFYLVAYDLHEPDKDKKYTDVEEQIYGLEDQCKILETTWIVKTKLNSTEILKRLSAALDDNDRAFVANIDLASCDGCLPLNARIWLEKKMAGFDLSNNNTGGFTCLQNQRNNVQHHLSRNRTTE